MDTNQFKLRDYRRMFMAAEAPSDDEMIGIWRGVNKGVATLVGFRQFVKEIHPTACGLYGDNIKVEQVSSEDVRQFGWRPKLDEFGNLRRHDRFQVQRPDGLGLFGHGAKYSYRNGGNRRFSSSRLLVDRVVKIDDQHLLGRAAIRTIFGNIPVAYFMLERAN